MEALERAHQRLEHLYEISKLFASFESIPRTLDSALGIATKTLPLRSAILIETDQGKSQIISWPSEGQSAERMCVVKQHLELTYAYLVGMPEDSLAPIEQTGPTALPRQEAEVGVLVHPFIVIPLVVGRRPPFGALQVEAARPLDERDLMFVNALANQLAVAVDRDRAWRTDISRRVREQALREKYEALAVENARLYKEAQRAVAAREQILAIVSHDLKTPIGTILMTVDVLAQKQPSEERRQGLSQAVARVRRAAMRITRLIEDLLDFASIESGTLSVHGQDEDVETIIQELVGSFEGIVLDKRLTLTAEVPEDLPRVHCDRDRILQVLSNMVANATKATSVGGTIQIGIERRARELLFSVSDTGHGMSEADRAHIFERYFRGNNAGYEGTGLGLAIAKGIVNAHQGKIWVESAIGQGSTFFFTIPTADAWRAARGLS